MRSPFVKGVVLGAITAAVVLTAGTALAGTGIGGVFNLGRTNTVNKASKLTGAAAGALLQVRNTGAGPALSLQPGAGAPPITTTSGTKVTNLNADSLDGLDSSAFVGGGGSVVHARLTEPLSSGNALILSVPGFGTVEASTGVGGVPNYRLFWRNGLSGSTMDVWYTVGATTTHASIAPSSGVYIAPIDTAADGTYTLRASYGSHTATLITSAHADAGGGVFSAQAIAQ